MQLLYYCGVYVHPVLPLLIEFSVFFRILAESFVDSIITYVISNRVQKHHDHLMCKLDDLELNELVKYKRTLSFMDFSLINRLHSKRRGFGFTEFVRNQYNHFPLNDITNRHLLCNLDTIAISINGIFSS